MFVYHLPYFVFPSLKDRLSRLCFLNRKQFWIFFEIFFILGFPTLCLHICFFQIPFYCTTKETILCGNLQSGKVIYYEAYCRCLILYCIINLQLPLPICDNSEGSIRGWMYQCLMYLLIKNQHNPSMKINVLVYMVCFTGLLK